MDELTLTKSSTELVINKFDGTKGEITAIISSIGNEDVVGDVMAPGAFDNVIKQYGDSEKKLPMFLQHSPLDIIGEWTNIRQKGNNILADGQLYLETSGGADANALISRGLIGSTSIGFRSADYEWKDDGGRIFNSVTLFETSLVISPANPKARILSVKNEDGQIDIRKLEKLLRDVDLSQKESKLVISAFKEELSKHRDVLTEDDYKADLVRRTIAQLKR